MSLALFSDPPSMAWMQVRIVAVTLPSLMQLQRLMRIEVRPKLMPVLRSGSTSKKEKWNPG